LLGSTTKDVTSIVKELALFEFKGKRDANLESCCETLISIPRSSVEPEGIFFRTKIRSSLHDESVDMLTFLRGYLKTENK
jgi:hypothetical protein